MLPTECCGSSPFRWHTPSVMHQALSLSIIHDHSDAATPFNIAAIAQVPAR